MCGLFRERFTFSVLMPLVCVVLLSCGGGGGGDGGSGLVFKCSDSPVAANQTAMLCGSRISNDTWLIQVVLGGPTLSTNIAGFDFDLLFDAADLSYVPGSA